MPLKYRISIILALVVLSIWALLPRDVTVRQRDENGILKDVKQRRIPLKYGLDLSGGMYIALEVDDSKQKIPSSEKGEALICRRNSLFPGACSIVGINSAWLSNFT